MGRAFSMKRGEEECMWDIGKIARRREITRKTQM
jgi:hypothetical protein